MGAVEDMARLRPERVVTMETWEIVKLARDACNEIGGDDLESTWCLDVAHLLNDALARLIPVPDQRRS